MSQHEYEKHFSLEEAVTLLPYVRTLSEETQGELDRIRGEIILYKRIAQVRLEEELDELSEKLEEEKGEGPPPELSSHEDIVDLLDDKVSQYEKVAKDYIVALNDKGVQVKDIEKGLVDFPYLDQNGKEYFLCWHLGEEALLFFHELHTGYGGRMPITLLPD